MAVTISWTSSDGGDTINPSGSNNTIKFTRGAFSTSVRVGQYQDSSYISNEAGTTNYAQIDNCKYVDASGVSVNGGARQDLTAIAPSGGTTVRIHFNESADPVQLQNTLFYVYDGDDVDNDPSGVTVYVYEASTTPSGTPSPAEASGLNDFGDSTWTNAHGTTTLSLITQSGLDTDKYHYLGLSATPTSIGAKNWAYQYETEFLT